MDRARPLSVALICWCSSVGILAPFRVILGQAIRLFGTSFTQRLRRPIIGFKIARALVDEIDVFEQKKAQNAWNKIISRMRLVIPGVENSIGVTTTPEGFKFVYSQFASEPTKSYSMVQASTYENMDYLPPDYIESLVETYPSQLISAYINGDFVNLTSGTVYRSYDRAKHRSREVVQNVYVLRGKEFHAVDQIKDGYNTPTVAQTIKEMYPKNKIIIYPDSSGKNRTRLGGASESDIAVLEGE